MFKPLLFPLQKVSLLCHPTPQGTEHWQQQLSFCRLVVSLNMTVPVSIDLQTKLLRSTCSPCTSPDGITHFYARNLKDTVVRCTVWTTGICLVVPCKTFSLRPNLYLYRGRRAGVTASLHRNFVSSCSISYSAIYTFHCQCCDYLRTWTRF